MLNTDVAETYSIDTLHPAFIDPLCSIPPTSPSVLSALPYELNKLAMQPRPLCMWYHVLEYLLGILLFHLRKAIVIERSVRAEL